MGVHGLWRLIEPSGKPVPLETLENKVLGVDISIWLHQAVKGFQDSKGAAVPNAHLLGIYHRVCKLLYFRIKPIFVFDGGVPALKKQTIAKRTQSKLRNVAEADKIQRQLLSTLLKHTAVSKVLTEKIEASIGSIPKEVSKSTKDDLYKLPSQAELDSTLSTSEDESISQSSTTDSSPSKQWDLHTIDVESTQFKSLPADVRHEILTDLKETRKQSSWGRLHELPKVSDDFSVYQMNRLRKRQAVQTALEDVEKEMGGKSLSLAELESILKDQGVINSANLGNRIASDETTKYLLVKDVKKAMEEARKNEEEDITEISETATNETSNTKNDKKKTNAEIEYEEDIQRAIALSLENEPSTSEEHTDSIKSDQSSNVTDNIRKNPAEFSFLENFNNEDFVSSSSEEELDVTIINSAKMSSAQSYMMEYSGLTPNEIAKIINSDSKKQNSKINTLPSISENDQSEENYLIQGTSKELLIEETDLNNKQNILEGSVKESETMDDVGIMSSTDSSDTEIDEQKCKIIKTKSIDIVINPNELLEKNDDLFSDIFEEANKSPILPHDDKNKEEIYIAKPISNNQKSLDIVETSNEEIVIEFPLNNKIMNQINSGCSSSTKETENGKEVNITVNPHQFDKENDLFGDIFGEENKTSEMDNQVKIVNADQSSEVNESNIVNIDSTEKNNTENQLENLVQLEKQVVNEPKNDINDGIKVNETAKKNMSEQELMKLKNDLYREKIELLSEKSSKERIAGNITDQMYQEAQDLLELFGLPYVIAPMEAEAQCAFLDAIELTDGTITDDSDIWLFGGRTVYKNFFNQSKYVMEFRAEDIKHDFKLTREQMILLALLVGSDYTTGLQGIGPVTAVEILSAFPPIKGKISEFSLSHSELLSGLREFRSWFLKGKSPGPGRNALKSKLKNINFTDNFPSVQVVEAYLDPKVETSREAFSWGKPNIMALIEFAKEKFGWTQSKTEDILNPVIKRLEEGRHQKSIRDYFKTRFKIHSDQVQSKMSKRVKSAITNMGKDPADIIAAELEQELKKKDLKKTRTRRTKREVEAPEFRKKKTPKAKAEAENKDNDSNQNEDNIMEREKIPHQPKTKKSNVKKSKSYPEPSTSQYPGVPSTSQTTEIREDISDKDIEVDSKIDVSEKIDLIRRRRKLKEAKAAADVKKRKLEKNRTKPDLKMLNNEVIPQELQADDEVNLLSQITSDSRQKVEDINKYLQDKVKHILTTSAEASKASPRSTPIVLQKSVQKPVNRPTRVPKKEVIPQKEKDKTTLLRNKLKAIEVFRKGKHGPGYVPRNERKKKLPKTDAELSESSDE